MISPAAYCLSVCLCEKAISTAKLPSSSSFFFILAKVDTKRFEKRVKGQHKLCHFSSSFSFVHFNNLFPLLRSFFLLLPFFPFLIFGCLCSKSASLYVESTGFHSHFFSLFFSSSGYQPLIPGYDRYVMSVNESTRTYNLHIANAQLEDEAEYECQTSATGASSASSSSSSSSASITSAASSAKPIRASANLHLIGKLFLPFLSFLLPLFLL